MLLLSKSIFGFESKTENRNQKFLFILGEQQMGYKELRVIKFDSEKEFKEEYKKRIEGHSTFKTNLKIFPFGKFIRETNSPYELFVVNNTELSMLQERIMSNAFQINDLLSKLPDVAKNSFVTSVLIDEIQSTNEIEGVHSSKKEIRQALNSTNRKSRFSGIVKLYRYLIEKSFQPLNKCEDIRFIYDELVSDEIEEKNRLDGKLFRKESVEITDGNKVIHRGNPTEESIIEDLGKFIVFINDESYPYLIRVLLSHYFFEYIHPFYDGNGRTGRYITCKYLSYKLDTLTALSFSHMINSQKKDYYRAFTTTSEKYNMGEGTMFVHQMLKIVREGQNELLENLEDSSYLLKNANNYINQINTIDIKCKQVLFLISQSTFFQGELTDKEMSEILDIHRSTLDSRLKILRGKKLIEQKTKKPSIHLLSDQLIKEIGGFE